MSMCVSQKLGIKGVALFLGLLNTATIFGMDYQKTKLTLWRRGEEIAGEEFIAATEQVVDYLKTLKRPTEGFNTIKYSCEAKSRLIRPVVRQTDLSGRTLYVDIRTVYDLQNCTEIP